MGLEFSQEAFVQYLRMRLRSERSNPLVIVEGETDKKALMPFLFGNVSPVPAGGKDNLLYAYDHLEGMYRAPVLFLLDCDGQTDIGRKGLPDLILTTNRDIEADAFFELAALSRIGFEVLSDGVERQDQVDAELVELEAATIDLALAIGLVRAAILEAGYPARFRPAPSERRRKVFLRDLASVVASCSRRKHLPVDVLELLEDTGRLVNWNRDQKRNLRVSVSELISGTCPLHAQSGCQGCLRRKYCNGHDIVHALTLILDLRYDVHLSEKEVDRSLRMTTDRQMVKKWEVHKRMTAWEGINSFSILRT